MGSYFLTSPKDSQSELQLNDVRGMLKSIEGLDRDYLVKWAGILRVNDLLKKAETSPVTEEKYRVMLMSRSSTERLLMAGRMLGSAKKLIAAGILSQKGPISETERKSRGCLV